MKKTKTVKRTTAAKTTDFEAKINTSMLYAPPAARRQFARGSRLRRVLLSAQAIAPARREAILARARREAPQVVAVMRDMFELVRLIEALGLEAA